VPDIQKLRFPHVAGREGKLYAGVNFTVRRDVARRVTGAARQAVQVIFGDFRRRRAELVQVSD